MMIFLLGILFFTFQGFSDELSDLASNLLRKAEDLATYDYQGYNSGERRSRNDVDVMFLTEQFRASAGLFQRIVQDNHSLADLRRATELMKSQITNFSSYSFRRQRLNEVNRILDDITTEVNRLAVRNTTGDQGVRSRRDVDDPNRRERYIRSRQQSGPGKVTWKGYVDDEVHIQFVDDKVYTQVLSGGVVRNDSYTYTNALPAYDTTVTLHKIRGRGVVTIFQQPSRSNNYQAVVRIYDSKAGDSEYEFELSWP